MGLQTIINYSETMTIDRRRVVGVQYTRSEIAKIGETPTRNPWRLNLTISAALRYGDNRNLLEAIDQLDKTTPEVVSFNKDTASSVFGVKASQGLAYMFAYQGAVRLSDGVTPNYSLLNSMTVSSFVGNQLVLNLNSIKPASVTGGQAAVVLAAGDLIQIQGYPYPFSVRSSVVMGTGTTITVTTHRPNFIGTAVNGNAINVGNQCQFKMFCPNMPTYKLSPGGSNAIINFNSDFQLYEWTGDIAVPGYWEFHQL